MAESHYSTTGPICPYCGHQHRADEPFYFDESNCDMECESCDRSFAMSIYHSTSWTTEERPS